MYSIRISLTADGGTTNFKKKLLFFCGERLIISTKTLLTDYVDLLFNNS